MQNEINELRNQIRTLKRMLFGVFGLVLVGGLLAATALQSVPDVIQAKKFEVVDNGGKVVGEFYVDKHNSGSFSLHNDEGYKVVGMNATKNGRGILGVNDQQGKAKILMYSDSVGAKVRLMNNKNEQMIGMGGNMESNGSMWFFRKSDGMPLCTILSSDEGAGKVATYNTEGVTDSLTTSTNTKKTVNE